MTRWVSGSSRSRLLVLVAAAIATLSFGCGSNSPTQPDFVNPAPSSGLAQPDFQTFETTSAKAPKVTVCHFQPGKNAWKALSISQNAVNAHLSNHDDCQGPGCTTSQTGTSLDASCQPMPAAACPCWSLGDLDALVASGDANCFIFPDFTTLFANNGFAEFSVSAGGSCTRSDGVANVRFSNLPDADWQTCVSQLSDVCSGL